MRLALMTLLLCSFMSYSQDCTSSLSGSVLDLHDGKPLEEATLIVVGTNKVVVTDLDGRFNIKGLCNRSYSIQVAHPSCLTRIFSVKVEGKSNRIFRLEHHIEEFNEITIKGKAFEDKAKTIENTKISRDEIEQNSSGTLGDVLNNISGVSSLNTGNAILKPLINGLHSSRVVIINNGVRMQDQEWGEEHAPNLDINTADNITLIKGAGALQYGGDAIGGVIIAESSNAPVKDSLYGKTIFSGMTNGRGGSLTTRLTKSTEKGWAFGIQGTLKRFGDFEAPNYVLSNTGIFERNASVKVALNRFNYTLEGYYSFFKNEIGILRASHLGASSDLARAINSGVPLRIDPFTYDINPPNQDVTHHLARLKATKLFDGIGKLSFQYDFQLNKRLEFDIRRGNLKGVPSVDIDLLTHSISLDLVSDLSDKLGLKTGIVGRFQKNTPDPSTEVRRLIPDYDRYDLGVYTIFDYQANDQLLLELGGRYDFTHLDVFKFYRTSFWEFRNYDQLFPEIVIDDLGTQVLTNPKLNFSNVSATAGMNYSFNTDYKLLFNYSLASRAPNPSELFSDGLHHSAARFEIGDLRFKSEIAHKFGLTFKKENARFNFSLSPYLNIINDFILIEPINFDTTRRGSFPFWEYRQTNARIFGFDIDASYTFTENISFEHQFSFLKGRDVTLDLPLINMPPAETKNEIVYKNKQFKNLQIALESRYVFRQNEFPDNNFEAFIVELDRDVLVDISTPPSGYHLLNFRSNLDFELGKNSKLTVGVGINNLLNTSYRNYLNRLRYYADDLGRNFLITLKINY